MTHPRPDAVGAPTPEELTAYLDDQADAALRARVETWLRHHPEAAAEIDGQRQLLRLWQATTPPQPREAEWAAVAARIEGALVQVRPVRRSRPVLLRLGVAGLAAAILLLLVWSPRPEPRPERPVGEPLTVVGSEEVEIVSVHAADRATLVVGEPPVAGPFVWASVGDIELEGVAPAADGMVPDLYVNEGSATPMIVVPVEEAPARGPGTVRE